MATVTQEQIQGLFDEIDSFNSEKKAISGSIKEAFANFAEEHQLNVKALKRTYRNYLDIQKNQVEFVEVDYSTDVLTQNFLPTEEVANAEEAVEEAAA